MARVALIAAAGIALSVSASGAATVSGTLLLKGKPQANAVVYLEGATRSPSAPPLQHVVMDQKNLEFVPQVLPIVRGTTVDFTNSDDIQHNVFSPSETADRFDLGAYGPGSSRGVTFDKAGEAVILCNIHMEMEAHVLVLEQPYFAVTGADGKYRINDVPAGRYSPRIWRERFLPTRPPVEIPASNDFVLDLRVE